MASLDILGNVVPYIKNEEEKLQEETLKLLGSWNGHAVDPLDAKLSAHCNRVPVEDGHMECVSIKLRTESFARRIDRRHGGSSLRSAGRDCRARREQPVEFVTAEDRPQPRLDRMRGNGMASTVGRLRPCSLFDWKFTVLSHNTIRGAAGAAILNAEILEKLGKLEPSGHMVDDRWRRSHEVCGHEVRRHLGRGRGSHRPHCADCRRTPRTRLLPIVVVSAMAKVTDQLIAAANAAGRGDRAGALAISARLRHRHHDTARKLLTEAPSFADTPTFCEISEWIDKKFESLDEIFRGLAAVGELTARTSDWWSALASSYQAVW